MEKKEILEKVYDYQLSEIPVGQIVVLTAGVGAAKAISGAIAGATGFDENVTKGIMALACFKFKPVKKLLGPDAAKLLGIGLAATAINDHWQIDQRVESTLAGWFGRAKQLAGGTTSTQNAATQTALQQAEAVAAAADNSYYASALGGY